MRYFLLLFLSLNAHAKFEIPGFELVYTAPVEAQLEAPDLRSPAEVWTEMFGAAKKTIDLEEMYAVGKPGEPLDAVMEALEKAGARGVKIRFTLETKMLRASDSATIDRLKKIKGLELRVFEFGKLGTQGIVHAKYFVVDGKAAYVGSQNFDWRSLKHIHETGLRITDKKIVSQIESIFAQDWKDAGLLAEGKPTPAYNEISKQTSGSQKAYLVASPPNMLPKGVVPSEIELVRLLDAAKKEVRVQLLDYSEAYRDKSEYKVVGDALRAAAKRGVKIKLMVSHWNSEKPGIDHLKALIAVPNIEVRMATIPLSKSGKIPFARVNHSKIMSVDDKIAWVGTSNWTGGYLDKLRNLEIVMKNEKMAKRIAALHDQLWSSPYTSVVEAAKEYAKPDKGGE